MFHIQRVSDCVGDTNRRAHIIAFAQTFRAERCERRGRFQMQNRWLGNFATGRHQIIGERAGQKCAIVAIAKFFQQRCANRLRKAATNLAISQGGIENFSGVVSGDVFVDAHAAGVAIDFHTADIEYEAIGKRRVDVIVGIRRGELFRRPENRFA